ncbi:MAG TPA: TonB C-terminal domain-containing protein [Gemmatimonadaceae bacterium]
MIRAQARPTGIAAPLVASAALHVLVAAALVLASRAEGKVNLPPMYKVELIAAPAGPPAIGTVTDAPADAATKAKTPPKPTPDAVPLKKPAAANAKTATKATPVPKSKAGASAPRAGGGAVGGAGADVANIRTEGIDFPFPGYLQNIVRQVRLNFAPTDKSMRTAEVFFFIRRDGSMAGFRFLQKSGSYSFDLECQGAVEAAAAAKAWGPLPTQFMDDVLPVIFRFDPKTLR